jgi:uncharacterized phage infection (PIP) family protein YhgE
MNIYNYLYFGIYRLLQKTSAKDVSEYIAAVWLAVLVGINITVIIKAIGVDVREHLSLTTYSSILFGSLIFLNVMLFLRKKKYVRIVDAHKVETKSKRNIRRLITIGYIILTFTSLAMF